MKWEIVIKIESDKHTQKQIEIAKSRAEEAILEALSYAVKFIDTKAFNKQ